MSEDPQMRMEEVEEAEENELLGGGEADGGDVDVGVDVDETAEDLMTDMKLEDETDQVRAMEPDFNWTYHIEIYPWSAEDMTDGFVRLIKLAQFSQVFMRKSVRKEVEDTEKVDDKLQGRQRKGCLHFYTDNFQNAKSIMRGATWKAMAAKELTFEITKRGPNVGQTETAYLELDTYNYSKCRFRDKTKGELKDRSAKVSNLPGTISREFIDVVFSRAYAVIGGTSIKEYLKDKEEKLQEKLVALKDFNGSLDFDCLSRGSCRAFVLSHKSIHIGGQKVSIEANDKETMVIPPFTHDVGVKKKQASESVSTPAPAKPSKPQLGRGRGNSGSRARGNIAAVRGALNSSGSPGRGFIKDINLATVRGRGAGRAIQPLMRPLSAPLTRAGPGMPVPMTGRQKMNEKMRRNNFGMAAGAGGGGGGILPIPGNVMGGRNSAMGSIGDSFKQEIADLQNQLEWSTQALEAKIAMLQQTQANSFYEGDMTGFETEDWDGTTYEYRDEYVDEEYELDDGHYPDHEMQNFPFETAAPVRQRSLLAGVPAVPYGTPQALGHIAPVPKTHTRPPRGALVAGMRRSDNRGMRRGRGSPRGNVTAYW